VELTLKQTYKNCDNQQGVLGRWEENIFGELAIAHLASLRLSSTTKKTQKKLKKNKIQI
jgi:hypothetical protein